MPKLIILKSAANGHLEKLPAVLCNNTKIPASSFFSIPVLAESSHSDSLFIRKEKINLITQSIPPTAFYENKLGITFSSLLIR
jgi:hypothetical protein